MRYFELGIIAVLIAGVFLVLAFGFNSSDAPNADNVAIATRRLVRRHDGRFARGKSLQDCVVEANDIRRGDLPFDEIGQIDRR